MRKFLFTILATATLCLGLMAGSPAADVDGAEHDDVLFKADDGVRVFADLYVVKDGKRAPIVMLFHQAGSNGLAEYAYHIPRLVEAGYNVLVVDQRSGGSQFGGENRTAERDGEDYTYCEAYPDLEAALDFVIDEGFRGSRYAWGSSYSASLVLRLGMERPDDLSGVVSFSPPIGGPMVPCSTTVYITNIEIPTFIGIPGSEVSKYQGKKKRSQRKMAAAAAKYVDEMYVADNGIHGASMLVPDRVGGDVEKHWNAVLYFMKSHP